VSAVAVSDALEGAGHQVIPVGIDRDGNWYLADRERSPLVAKGVPASLRLPSGTLQAAGDEVGFDVVFPVLHGPFGEDGTIQGVFEIAGVPYVGCGVLSSALAMDKDNAKRVIEAAGIATTPWMVVRAGEFSDPGDTVTRLVGQLGLPLFVKPAELGSSVGISKADSEAAVKDGILTAFSYGDKVIVEEAIRGREIEVAVLEGPRVSVPGEIITGEQWYDYDAKYNDESSECVAPADLTESEVAVVRELAGRAFTAMECRGLARVDFLYEAGGRGFLLNEINTMPGFTPISGFPKMWQASGMSYPELCNELITIALS
jgi:D-alanine-D-alanine ligase